MNQDEDSPIYNAIPHFQPPFVVSHVPPAVVERDGAVLTSTLVPVVQYMPMMTMVRTKEKKEEIPCNLPQNDGKSRDKAAIKIQQKYRQYSRKKQFSDREINPIIKYHRPDIYFTAIIIKEVATDFIQDLIIEVSDDIYLPIKNNSFFKVLRTSYHLLQNEIYTSIYEALDEIMIKENLGSIKNLNQFGISSWVSEAISSEIDTTVRQFIRETVESFIQEKRNENILDILLNEILLEMDLLGASMEELGIIDFIMEILDLETFILVQNLLFDMSVESKLMVYTRPRSHAKSKKVDLIMDNVLDAMIFDQILEYKVNNQISALETFQSGLTSACPKMNNEKSTSTGSPNSSIDQLANIVLQKALIKNLTDSVPPELQKYRLPNLVASYAKRLKLARRSEMNPRIPPTRIIISDFSKTPTEAERLSNIRGSLSKEKNKKLVRSGYKRKIPRRDSNDNYDRLKVNDFGSRRTSRQSSMMVHTISQSVSAGTSFKELPIPESKRVPKIQTSRQNSQYRSNVTRGTMSFVRPHPHNISNAVLKTRVKLKDFSRSLNTEPKTSLRMKQLEEIDNLMIALKDTQISRKTLEMAILVPEEIVKSKAKLYYRDFEYIRSWTPEPTLAAHRLASANERARGSEMISPIGEKDEKSHVPDMIHPAIDDSTTSPKLADPRKVKSVINAPVMQKIKTIMTKTSTKAAKPVPKVTRVKPRKPQTMSVAKMLVRPMDLFQSDSDQNLERSEKPKTSCWWNASELKVLRTRLINKKESEKQIKEEDKLQNDKFKTANQIQRPNSHTAHKSTKYMKSPSSIDQLPIDPQLDREYIMHTQAVAQGLRSNFRNSIWLPTGRPTSRPKTASVFHMENGSHTTIRRRSFSMGNQKIGVAVELPAEPGLGYLQIYVPRKYPEHLI